MPASPLTPPRPGDALSSSTWPGFRQGRSGLRIRQGIPRLRLKQRPANLAPERTRPGLHHGQRLGRRPGLRVDEGPGFRAFRQRLRSLRAPHRVHGLRLRRVLRRPGRLADRVGEVPPQLGVRETEGHGSGISTMPRDGASLSALPPVSRMPCSAVRATGSGQRLLHRMLDQRPVDQRHHRLGNRLRRRKEPRAQPAAGPMKATA